MLEVWPDLQAKGVRQIKKVLFLNSLLACSPTLSGGTWMSAVPFAQLFIAYPDAALIPRLLTFEAGMRSFIFSLFSHHPLPLFFFFFN